MAELALPDELADGILDHPATRAYHAQLESLTAAARSDRLAAKAAMTQARQIQQGNPLKDSIWSSTENRVRKQGLYDLYIQSTILGSIVDAIAQRFVSGSWSIAAIKDVAGIQGVVKGDPADQLMLADFFSYCNPDEDLKQILYGCVTDLCIFGETFLEVVPKGRLPYELYSCPTIKLDTVHDRFGRVQYFTFADVDSPQTPERLDSDWIVRIWVPSRKDPLRAFSMIEGMVNPLYSDQMMTRAQQKTFENMSSMCPIVTQLPENAGRNQALDMQSYIEEYYQGVLNANRERVSYGGATVTALPLKGIDADFLQGREEARYEAMGRAHVPPDVVGYESPGHLGGGGVSESHERNFTQNVLHFYKHILFEKLNYRIIRSMFNVEGWCLHQDFADAIGDPDAEQVYTLNEKRAQKGLPKLPDERGELTLLEIKSHAEMLKGDLAGQQPGQGQQDGLSPDQAEQQTTAAQDKTQDAANDTTADGKDGRPNTQTESAPALSTTYSYGSTQVDLPPMIAGAMLALGRQIASDDLADDGREDCPHVTVKYGLVSTDADVLRTVRAICAAEPPVTLRFGPTSLFASSETGGDYDVVIVPVESDGLQRLNRLISSLVPTVNTHPIYQPHATVAYVKAGRGQAYAGLPDMASQSVTVTYVMFCDRHGTKTYLPLGQL